MTGDVAPIGAAMQVSLVSVPGSRPHEGSAAAIVLPRMLQLLDLNAGPQTRREQAEADRDDRLRRRDADHEQALAHISQEPRASDKLARAERKMLPGSKAARRQQAERQAGKGARGEDTGFREALAGARQRSTESKTPAETHASASTASEKKPGSSPQNDTARATGNTAKPEGQAAAKPSPTPPGPTQTNASTVAALGGRSGAVTPTLDPGAEAAIKGLKVEAAGKITAATGAARSGATARGGNSTNNAISPASPTDAKSTATTRGTARGAQVADESEPQRAADANTERILRTIHFRLGEKRSTATLRMDPPELGNIKLHMDLREGQLSLQIEAESNTARRLLTEQRDALRHGLEATGIQLERFEVRAPQQTAPGDGNANLPQHENVPHHGQQESPQRDAHSAGGGSTGGTEATTVEQARESEPSRTVLELATESLVNVWA